MPSPVLIGSTYYLRIQVPKDVSERAKGTKFSVPVAGSSKVVTVGTGVKVSLQTKDPSEAKIRFVSALAAVSRPGKPTERALCAIDGVDGSLCMESLGQHWFPDLDDVRDKVKFGATNTTK